jgi:hypothetical protein
VYIAISCSRPEGLHYDYNYSAAIVNAALKGLRYNGGAAVVGQPF